MFPLCNLNQSPNSRPNEVTEEDLKDLVSLLSQVNMIQRYVFMRCSQWYLDAGRVAVERAEREFVIVDMPPRARVLGASPYEDEYEMEAVESGVYRE